MTRPWTWSSITVSPSRGAFRRTTKGASGGAVGRASRQGLSIRNGRRSAWARSRCGGQLLGGHVAAIGVAAGEQLVRDLGVAGGELRLVIFVAVPVEAEPAHPVEDRVDRRLGRARLVGILDPQQEAAAMVAGVEPVEQGGAGAADMEEAGRRGREAGDDLVAGRLRSSAFSPRMRAMAAGDASAPSIADRPRQSRDP